MIKIGQRGDREAKKRIEEGGRGGMQNYRIEERRREEKQTRNKGWGERGSKKRGREREEGRKDGREVEEVIKVERRGKGREKRVDG